MKKFLKSIFLFTFITLGLCFNCAFALPEEAPSLSSHEALQNLERAKSKYGSDSKQSQKASNPQQENSPPANTPTQNTPSQSTPSQNTPSQSSPAQNPQTQTPSVANSSPTPAQQPSSDTKQQAPTTQEKPAKKKVIEKKVEEKPKEEVNEENNEESQPEENRAEDTAPKDLPSVKESEILLPQVVASPDKPESKTSLTTGLIAWSLIGVGILLVLIVLIKGRKSPDIDLSKLNVKSRKKKKGKMLPKSYYRKKY